MDSKKRTIRVLVGDFKDMETDIGKALEDDDDFQKKPDRTIFIRPELVPTLLSCQKLRLLLRLRGEDLNMSELAHQLRRKIESVSRDIAQLEGYGLITVEKKGRERHPRLAGDIQIII